MAFGITPFGRVFIPESRNRVSSKAILETTNPPTKFESVRIGREIAARDFESGRRSTSVSGIGPGVVR